ncbi:MAG: RCC1 repeat- and reductase domain-containing protein [Candidatus Desulfofervidus auxilii]|nr:RCC1 repeat- and reductase domain-containing protein [Candidatus Desulfofervidus auxilii]
MGLILKSIKREKSIPKSELYLYNSIYTCGYNNGFCNLGIGSEVLNRNLPSIVVKDPIGYVTDVTFISCGSNHTLALTKDNKVMAWGVGGAGRLGNGSTEKACSAIYVKNPSGTGHLSNIKKIAVMTSGSHSLVIDFDGCVWAWGWNFSGQLGDGTTTDRYLPVRVKGINGNGYLCNIIKIVAGGRSSFALTEDGFVLRWGLKFEDFANYYTTPRIQPGPGGSGYLYNVTNIFASGNTAFAIKSDGTVYAWGANYYGQLGINSTDLTKDYPTKVKDVDGVSDLKDVIQIAPGWEHTLFLKSDGTVYACGRNNDGQLGDGTTTNRYKIVRVKNLTNIIYIAAGSSHSLAVKSDGSVYAWGRNNNGQLGDGTYTNRHTPVKVKNEDGTGYLSDIVCVSAGMEFSAFLKQKRIPTEDI